MLLRKSLAKNGEKRDGAVGEKVAQANFLFSIIIVFLKGARTVF